ncbi:hypothetical protein QMK19_00220 [Streptomyces sp. H10-C2]|uniref:hypothetical protein n=1 Tax=unclassified Streptomyces TaxID=2593676 RepID=UPI0024B90144|nr:MULTISPECIES: hypothetical protein [unclassified Streptomyces]MDJ0340404.1 hypothetical protein [Streptomyces sp. PH10-H1]MDJ0368148.1 hypothetical protein [Streptomyces sp. H10-C2]
MGWTHDYCDVSRTRRNLVAAVNRATPVAVLPEGEHQLGIPRILRRRARWVGARLRHPRSD